MRRVHRSLLIAMLTGVMTLLLAGTALAQEDNPPYPPPASEDLTCTPSNPEPGDEVVCTAGGFQEGSTARWQANCGGQGNQFRGTDEVNEDGFTQFEFTLNDNARGACSIQVRGIGADGRPLTMSETLPVDTGGPGRDGRGVADTGGEFTVGMALAAGVLVLGSALVLVSRRKVNQFEVEAK
jgi:LPXTG-motif cell wall-anchored protein